MTKAIVEVSWGCGERPDRESVELNFDPLPKVGEVIRCDFSGTSTPQVWDVRVREVTHDCTMHGRASDQTVRLDCSPIRPFYAPPTH